MRSQLILSVAALSLLMSSAPLPAQTSGPQRSTADSLRQSVHTSPDWKLIEPHLPDPATAPVDMLETQADLLRVRRFPDDALDYYNYALSRGGDQAKLLNKIGITQMELGNPSVAKAYFQRVLKLHRKDPQAWNNLGAVEFMERNYNAAIQCYKHAIKLNKKFAVSHSNLGMAYVERRDFDSARPELMLAMKLDPLLFTQSSSSGATLHMMSANDRANFCFEMAKVYARMGNEAEMLHQLQTASEAGMNVQRSMADDKDLSLYVKDPRVVQLVMVAKSMREGRLLRSTVASALPPATPVPSLPPAPAQ